MKKFILPLNRVLGLSNTWSSMPDIQCIISNTTYIIWQKSSAKVNRKCLLGLFCAGLPKNAWYAQSILCRVFKDLNLWKNMSNYEYFQRLKMSSYTSTITLNCSRKQHKQRIECGLANKSPSVTAFKPYM